MVSNENTYWDRFVRFLNPYLEASYPVLLSLFGTLVIVLGIAAVFPDANAGVGGTFLSYFDAGELGLSIFSVSSALFFAILTKGGVKGPGIAVIFFALFILPLIISAVIVGSNPGFEEDGLTKNQLAILWYVYGGFHFLWFLVLVSWSGPDIEGKSEQSRERVKALKDRKVTDDVQ